MYAIATERKHTHTHIILSPPSICYSVQLWCGASAMCIVQHNIIHMLSVELCWIVHPLLRPETHLCICVSFTANGKYTYTTVTHAASIPWRPYITMLCCVSVDTNVVRPGIVSEMSRLCMPSTELRQRRRRRRKRTVILVCDVHTSNGEWTFPCTCTHSPSSAVCLSSSKRGQSLMREVKTCVTNYATLIDSKNKMQCLMNVYIVYLS